MKTVFILPYFGKFPEYFPLYLFSCGWNKDFEWLIITDDRTCYQYPDNVHVIYMTFHQLYELIQSKFDFQISLDRPHKLCDYRPAYGYIFRDYIKKYDFWGHCDPDCIWGDLKQFVTPDLLMKYDKIFTHGHLTLYRNTCENNMRFTLPCRGESEYYKKVFSLPESFIFDEQYIKSINNIFEDNHFLLWTQNVVADISPYHTNFRLDIYNHGKKEYESEVVRKQIFFWDKGHLKRVYLSNKMQVTEEFAYIHLQKRKMKSVELESRISFLITPGGFRLLPPGWQEQGLLKFYYYHWINKQYFRVKYSFLKIKLKKFIG